MPTPADTAALERIVGESPVPIIADVHFQFERALEAIAAGAAKIRLNPGNIPIATRSAGSSTPPARRAWPSAWGSTRARWSSGAIRPAARPTWPGPLDELMVQKLAEYLQTFQEAGFEDLVLSAKSHDAVTCVSVNRTIARRWDYPLHLGVTHAGTAQTGAIRSAAAVATLLAEGIGDTLRISYAGDPLSEVATALELLYSLRLRPREGVDLIACPTCGRAMADVAALAEAIGRALAELKAPITVAVMGCVVNGPGEAANADLAVCAGDGKAALYCGGQTHPLCAG